MKKRMMLAALLLVSVAVAVSGTDFEERISKKSWYRDYFNEVIYRKDRNILVEHQPRLKEPYSDIDPGFAEITYWFDDAGRYWDRLDCTKLDDTSWSLRMCEFHRKSMSIYRDADITGSLHWMQRSPDTAFIAGLTVSICIYIWKTGKHYTKHTVPMMNQKELR